GCDRIRKPLRYHRHRALDVFRRAHELRGAASLQCELLQQGSVYVATEAEREHARIPAQLACFRRDRVSACLSDRRLAIGEKEHDLEPVRSIAVIAAPQGL